MNLGAFVAMIISFTGAAVTIVAAIALAIRFNRRPEGSAREELSEELDALRARLAELEQRDLRVEELEERLDFVERALGRSRAGAQLRNPAEQ